MLEFLILNNRFEAAYKFYDSSNKNYKQQLITHFHKGKRSQFLKLYLLLRKEEKLEFYLRVYFLIYSIHPSLKAKGSIPEEEINAFKEYLDTKGADLAKTNQFLEFYALPFVKKPLEHASFKSLFKKQWISNLTEKLHIFLQQQDKRMKEEIMGLDSVSRQNQESRRLRSPQFSQPVEQSPNLKMLQQKNKNLFEQIQQYKTKYAMLQKNNQALIQSFNSHLMESQNKWFQITRELTSNSRTLIELIVRANSGLTNDRRFQRVKKRTQKFQKIVKKQLDELMNQSNDLSIFDKPSVNQVSYSASVTPNISQRNITTFVSIDEFIPTNYVALIRDFKKMPDDQKVSVLQGFSWRIIKSKNKWIRRETIVGLIVNDVLGLMNGDIQNLLFNKNLMFFVISLFLYISEDSYGSKVLFRNGGLYKQIVDLIPQVLADKNYSCLSVLLQILQNIWHNHQILLELIHLNIINTCVNTLLQDIEVLNSDQLLESIVTLLLNVTALNQGLDAYQEQVNIFFTLSEAFKSASDSNRNLIGAIMYALIGRKTMWKRAHEAKLPIFIDDLIKIDERSNKQQLKLIQQKLHTFQMGKTIDVQDYENEQSVDSNLEEQLFERNEEELEHLEEYIKGHQMLNAKYSLKSKEADKQKEEISKIMRQFIGKEVEDKKEEKKVEKQGRPRINQKEEGRPNVMVKLPDIKKKQAKNQTIEALSQIVNDSKQKVSDKKEYYSYKSPNFKQNEEKSGFSIQGESMDRYKDSHPAKQRINSFDIQRQIHEQKIIRRNPTKHQKTQGVQKQNDKKGNNKKSMEKPEYRIKKSSSVEKGIGINKKIQGNYQTNKNASNVSDFKSIEGMRSPPQKRTREEVLRMLNQELRAEKKAEGGERKLSNKCLPTNPLPPPRENSMMKKNNFVGPVQQFQQAFSSKPKIRRTPPKQDQL